APGRQTTGNAIVCLTKAVSRVRAPAGLGGEFRNHGSMMTWSTKHQAQASPGSIERMIGCLVAWKCLVACLFFDESQQPTWPHERHMRRCTHESPVLRHSSQPRVCGLTSWIWSWCVQVFIDWFLLRRSEHCYGRPAAGPGNGSPQGVNPHECLPCAA